MKRMLKMLPVAVALTFATPVTAQDQGPADKRAQVESRLKELRMRVLREHVGLSPADSAEAEKILVRASKERQRIKTNARTHRQKLRALLKSDSDDQKAYRSAIQGLRQAQNQLHQLKNREFEELSKRLTPKQQAKLVAGLRHVKQKMRQAMRKHRRGR